MSKLLRYHYQGDSVFITSVTFNREPILIDHYDLLRKAIVLAKMKYNFEELAWVVLPDHLHCIYFSPDMDISKVIQAIKMSFSANYRRLLGMQSGHIWQRRFWDHIIRNEKDMRKHMDYIHFDPLKHGLTNDIANYKYSSFHQYYAEEEFVSNHGCKEHIKFEGYFGE